MVRRGRPRPLSGFESRPFPLEYSVSGEWGLIQPDALKKRKGPGYFGSSCRGKAPLYSILLMPRLKLSSVRPYRGCSKPGCARSPVYRHHKGGERTFVRHLRHLVWGGLRADYLAFRRRYHSFHQEDIVDVCGDHHEEIHYILEQFDLDWMVENDCIKAFGNFTWVEAMKLVEARRNATNAWLRERTPGRTERKFTNFP